MRAPCRPSSTLIGAALLLGAAAVAPAQPAPAQGGASSAAIYTCIDDKGRKITSDRPIVECLSREQRVLNKDGSLRTVKPPTLTTEERAAAEAAERRSAVEKSAQADAVRRDRNLVIRFPDEATHRKAREAALDTVRQAIKATELRQAELVKERLPLDEEAEFFKGRQMPARLKIQVDANDAALDAQRSAVQNQQAELVRINRLYDVELERLRKLWAGAQPGSVGPATAPTAAEPSRRAASSAVR